MMCVCPVCGKELDHETFYNPVHDDTSYYDFCVSCGWDNYPEYLLEEETEENC